ncbi:MAG: enoyl-CoA hydratase-related protein [Acidobacteriia bacterium]|nr:enoyl-CoA hydratase-related protein [Terriglobia bacterium]
MKSHESPVLVLRRDAVATITLNRPAKLNAFDGEMIRLLAEALEELSADTSRLRAVILTGAGSGFCAGADLDFLLDLRRETRRDKFQRLLEDGRRVVTSLFQIPVPVIARVQGHAAGGGCSLALACDIRVAGRSARFTQAFAKIGVHADFGATYTLPQLIGEPKARELFFTGETVDAETALRLGLVNQVAEDSKLDAAVESLLQTFQSRAPISLQLIKKTLWEQSREALREALDREMKAQMRCFETEDFLKGLEAFVGKSKVAFEGR